MRARVSVTTDEEPNMRDDGRFAREMRDEG